MRKAALLLALTLALAGCANRERPVDNSTTAEDDDWVLDQARQQARTNWILFDY